jgi:copper chaperone
MKMMSTTTTSFTVTGMTCGRCVAAVTDEISKVENVTSVNVDLPTGVVTVTSEGPIDPAAIEGAVDEAGYGVAS